jgi:hypothetical protein
MLARIAMTAKTIRDMRLREVRLEPEEAKLGEEVKLGEEAKPETGRATEADIAGTDIEPAER